MPLTATQNNTVLLKAFVAEFYGLGGRILYARK
jgi:hypothetical protein